MSKIIKILFSPKLAVLALFSFAVAMATATFIENDFGTQTAFTVIYKAWWFEMIMVILGLNFLGNMFKYKLFRKEKWSVLLFHISFIVILIGAGITRYVAYEGIMRIREGATSDVIISDRVFVQAHITDSNGKTINIHKEKTFSPIQKTSFSIKNDELSKPVHLEFKEFITDAIPEVIDSENKGEPLIQMVVSAGNGRESMYLKKGEIERLGGHGHELAFENENSKELNIIEEDGVLKLKPKQQVTFFEMQTQNAGNLVLDSLQVLKERVLYRSADYSFVIMSYHPNAEIKMVSGAEKKKDNDELKDDVLILTATVGNTTEDVSILYRHGALPISEQVEIEDVSLNLAYGAIPLKTPFQIKLNDFQLERYPGSTSPSSYASEVTVIDNNEETPYRIFMNNVLDYRGYRFFQASYDTDEKGTVLAVNHDRAGTLITYLGYFLMTLGMLWTLFGANSRFGIIRKKLQKINAKTTAIIALLVFSALQSGFAQESKNLDSLVQSQVVSKEHGAIFGRILVQDLDGRIKPINTLASEFLRKISRKTTFKYNDTKLDANQLFIALHGNPRLWTDIPLIKIDRQKGGKLFDSIPYHNNNLAAFNDFLDLQSGYILEKQVEEANTKKPAERSEFDKEILKVDERFNILFNIFSGNYLKIFPKRNDATKTWYSQNHTFEDFNEEDAGFAQGILTQYFAEVSEAKISGDWAHAEDKLAYIQKFQDVLAEDIIPSKQLIEAELWYNNMNLYLWLFITYFVFGTALLLLAVTRIFSQSKFVKTLFNLLLLIIFLAFLLHTGNLILRWYVAQHAPWSNGYEMITFAAWSLMLIGIIFYKKSDFVLALATIFTGTLLFVSYLDWLSPEITNLMPVLKSYWLKIHVATIISSYAPLALSALLGLMALILMIIRNDKNKKIIDIKIKELSYINELSMIIGLFILSIGTFLGGVWANESWGRYWAWDPKETWALISMIVYAAILHFHLIPGLKGRFTLNVASVFAFYSIIMTSFGVNYYLTGLHSYATGDPVPIPKFIYVVTAIVIALSITAYYRQRKTSK
ncbi:cytochrome c biogenesis protein [Urechidicola vernalis]|uniref:Cytochrome c biogenesis protein CcsA n=1 Tax=Urechidicola vernalis TaxID=3075600 RepID=A0ABU2Y301_9FLAO|nr:cytochrome c biogenesis protein CcsA [Urechidicola sp. P050]MDT0551620.1 cytochrome c biogenesis protein CcsA [Urechidicola sp. P050]